MGGGEAVSEMADTGVAEESAVTGPPTGPRTRTAWYASLAVAGMLAIATATGTAVYELGSPGGSVVAQAAAGPRPAATVGGTQSAAPAPAPVPVPAVTATGAPAPDPTVKGYVHGSVHSGDIRYFLLPVPADAGAYGDADGTAQTCGQIASTLSDPGTAGTVLKQLGCSGGAYRTYQTDDNAFTVTVELIHFDSDADAGQWVAGMSFNNGDTFTIPGVSNAQGVALNPTDSADTGDLQGLSHLGDMEYEIDIQGVGAVPHAMLTQLMQQEEKLLSTGH
jgi:hypothetical protein